MKNQIKVEVYTDSTCDNFKKKLDDANIHYINKPKNPSITVFPTTIIYNLETGTYRIEGDKLEEIIAYFEDRSPIRDKV